RPACLWQPPLSPVSAAYNPAMAPAPPGPTTARAALAPHLYRPRGPTPVSPLASTLRVPRHVHRFGGSPQTARSSAALHRHALPRLSRLPAHLGPAAPVPSPHSLYRPGWWPLRGPHDLAPLQSQLLCACASPLPHLPCALQSRDAPGRPAGVHRSPGLDHPLERPPSGASSRPLRLHLPRPLCLQGRHLSQPYWLAHGSPGHLSRPPNGQ